MAEKRLQVKRRRCATQRAGATPALNDLLSLMGIAEEGRKVLVDLYSSPPAAETDLTEAHRILEEALRRLSTVQSPSAGGKSHIRKSASNTRSHRWMATVLEGRIFVNGNEVGDCIDWDDHQYTVSSLMPKWELARRAFNAGREVGARHGPQPSTVSRTIEV